jgi:hypothetical protein
LRLLPSERIREESVFGLTPRNSAAPPMPDILWFERSNIFAFETFEIVTPNDLGTGRVCRFLFMIWHSGLQASESQTDLPGQERQDFPSRWGASIQA